MALAADNEVEKWLNSCKLSCLYEPLMKEGWDDLETISSIEMEGDFQGLIDDIEQHISLKNSQKVKLRNAIKKLKESESGKLQAARLSSANWNNKNNGGNEMKENKMDKMEKKEEKKEDDLLPFACENCGQSISQCNLYYCALCNSDIGTLFDRKYYCKQDLLQLHKRHKKCESHRNEAIKLLNNNQIGGASIIHQLTLDITKLEKEKMRSMQCAQQGIKSWILAKQDKVSEYATSACNVVADGTILMSIAKELEFVTGGVSDLVAIDGLTDWCIWAGTACVAADIGFAAIKYGRGDITTKQFGTHICKSIVRTGAMYQASVIGMLVGGITGVTAGFVVGGLASAVLPPFAVANGCMWIGSFIGSIAATRFSNAAIDAFFDKYFPNGDDAARKSDIEKAFAFFQYNENEIKQFRQNCEKSEQSLNARFKVYAKLHHPDRNGGSNEKFLELYTNYGLLKGVLQCDASEKSIDSFLKEVNPLSFLATANSN